MRELGRADQSAHVLAFIRECVREQWVRWTYHANMRLAHRLVRRGCAGSNFRVVTAYWPEPDEWDDARKRRSTS